MNTANETVISDEESQNELPQNAPFAPKDAKYFSELGKYI